MTLPSQKKKKIIIIIIIIIWFSVKVLSFYVLKYLHTNS